MTELLEPSVHRLLSHATESHIPAWLPWPMPTGWAVSGIGSAADGVSIIACSGPALLEGIADIFIIAEEPGGTFAPTAAGTAPADDAFTTTSRAADARIAVDDHTAPMWRVPCEPDRDVLIGEAAGRWLWLITFPDTASLLVSDNLRLVSLSRLTAELDVVPVTGLTSRRPW